MSSFRRLSRLLAPVAVAGVAVVATAGASTATPGVGGTGQASISSVKVDKGVLSGVLTVRSTGAAISPSSLQAMVGGTAYPVQVKPVNRTKRATMLVVDTSGSMGSAGMATVRAAVGAFLADAPKDVAVGLVSFAATAGVDVSPTKDRSRVQRAVNGLKSRGETTLYDAVALAAPALAGFDDRSIILLSDGGDTKSTKATKASATAALKKYGVRAEVIGFKTADSDNAVLKGFADAGGGSVAAAGNEDAVRTAFEAAAKALDSQVTFTVKPDASVRSAQPVVVTGTASGAPFRAEAVVDFGAAPAVAPSTPSSQATVADDDDTRDSALARITAPTGLRSTLLLGVGATFLGLLVLGAALVAPTFRSGRKQRVDTIESYVSPGTTVQTERPSSVTPSAISSSLVNIGERVMQGRESTSKTMALIQRADLPLRAGEWWVLRLVAVVAGMAVVLLFFNGSPGMTFVGLVIGALLGAFLPAFVLRFLAKRRSKKFESQLPDVLSLVASSLSTGFSLLQGLDAVAKDAAEPAAKEFSRALAETRIGADVGDSLEHMAERMDSQNMRWTSMAIRIQREVGGNLAETLKTTGKTLREREALQRHVRALSAEGRLSAYILIALPIGIFLFTMKQNREYIELLWTTSIGLAMLGAGIVSLIIGIFWMRKVVDVQV
jgi:tight adherence protein B